MPVPGVITRPGALAFSRLCTLATCASSTVSAARTCVTEFPIARRCVPPAVPVTTNWSSSIAVSASRITTFMSPTRTTCWSTAR